MLFNKKSVPGDGNFLNDIVERYFGGIALIALSRFPAGGWGIVGTVDIGGCFIAIRS